MGAAELCRAAGTTATPPAAHGGRWRHRARARAPATRALETVGGGRAPRRAPPLTDDQADALRAVQAATRDGGPLLLHGVTGSGKTEVYLRAIQEARARGGSIVLVPKIALTPQLLSRLRASGRGRQHLALGDVGGRARRELRACARARPTSCSARAAPSSRRSRGSGWWWSTRSTASYKQARRPATTPARLPPAAPAPPARPSIYGTATPRPETWHALPGGRSGHGRQPRRPRSRSSTCACRARAQCQGRSPRPSTRPPRAARRRCCWRAGAGSR